MKKIFLIAAFMVFVLPSMAYDWVAKDTRSLKNDMIEFAAQFADSVKGSEAEPLIRSFIVKEKADTSTIGWMDATLELVWQIEEKYPPIKADGSMHSTIRRMALQLLDYPLHVDNIGTEKGPAKATEEEKDAFKRFCARYKARARDRFLDWLDAPRPKEGCIELFKIYNMGFMLRTSKHTLAIDIRWEGTMKEAEKIAAFSDAFLLTHAHGDHYSENMLSALAAAEKPMYLSEDIVPQAERKFVAEGDCLSPIDMGGIKVTSLMGAQGTTPCNIFMIDMDGWRIVDNGDNSMMDKEREIAGKGPYDIVIAAVWNCVPNILAAAMKDGGRQVFFPAHENELGHGVDHRESYHESYSRKDRLGDPDFTYPDHILMDIGEFYTLSR